MLYREHKTQGYRGSERAVYRYLNLLVAQSSSQAVPPTMVPILRE